jgi:DNA-binding transcriptional ArsR family regulator
MVKKVSIWLTLEPLIYSEPKHLAEISKRVKKPHTTVRKQLAIFERIGLISKEKKGRQTFYRVKQIPLLIDYLTIIEKERIIRRCQEDLLLKEIVNNLHVLNNSILMFGSAVNSVKKARDIDLVIIGKFRSDRIKDIEKKLRLKLHVINVENLSNITNTLKNEIVKKHLIIQGSEEIIKWLIE